jgi:hypothetical protein
LRLNALLSSNEKSRHHNLKPLLPSSPRDMFSSAPSPTSARSTAIRQEVSRRARSPHMRVAAIACATAKVWLSEPIAPTIWTPSGPDRHRKLLAVRPAPCPRIKSAHACPSPSARIKRHYRKSAMRAPVASRGKHWNDDGHVQRRVNGWGGQP